MKIYSTDVREEVNKPKVPIIMFEPVDKGYIPPRHGKTRKDHLSGAHANRFKNRRERMDWQKGDGMYNRNRTNKDFPLYTCNGKQSRRLKLN